MILNFKFYLRLIGVALFLLIVLGGIYLYKTNQSLRLENERILSNQSNLLINSNNIKLELTAKELKEFKSELLKEIKDSLNIKPKQITNINNIYSTFNIDSSKQYHSIKVADNTYSIDINEQCFKMSGIYNTTLNTFTLNTFNYNDTIRIIDYWKRNKWLGLRIGKKVYYRDSYSKCNSKVKTEVINISNKK